MNEAEKQAYRARYEEKKRRGELFFPHTIAKDAVVSLLVFVVLLGLVLLVGIPDGAPANPADTSYIPRPEWYFLWAYEILKYFPGKLEGIAITGLGLLIAVGLFGLPFLDRGPKRHPLNRPVATSMMLAVVVGLGLLTWRAAATTPAQPEVARVGASVAEQIAAGGELYAAYCSGCHGVAGEGGEIAGLPGEFTGPLNDQDFLATHSEDTLFDVIDIGWESAGMPPFGVAHGGQLADPDIRAIVAFIRAWRTSPEDAGSGGEDLAQVETPTFSQHVQPILDRRCASCHGQRARGGYRVTDYDAALTSGDHAPVILPGDAGGSILVRMLKGETTEAGGQMPPGSPLQEEQIELIIRWIDQGAAR